ncbi:MAG: hypothetical protein EOM64_08220, partial [Erysipelotrichia bacterium]|nr:hypothetical protein [Erysipelotrichia bacterium]
LINEIIQSAYSLMVDQGQVLIGIDGRCASGKSTLGRILAEELDAALVHMDDYFLRPEQRTEERYLEAGGNTDRERIRSEVINPWLKHQSVMIRPFDCSTMQIKTGSEVPWNPIMIIEGTYSMHPYLKDVFDLKVFLAIDAEKQMQRIMNRETPESVLRFKNRWIPLEEAYFSACKPEFDADFVIADMETE